MPLGEAGSGFRVGRSGVDSILFSGLEREFLPSDRCALEKGNFRTGRSKM